MLTYGPDLGREATAEALVWAWEHWATAPKRAGRRAGDTPCQTRFGLPDQWGTFTCDLTFAGR